MDQAVTKLSRSLRKEELQTLAMHMGINCDAKLKKEELARSILQYVATRGGVHPNLSIKGVALPLHAKPKARPAKRTPSNTASVALSTSIEMMKDQLASTLAQNALNVKGVAPRLVTALSAAIDATTKVKESVKSDERKQRRS